MKVNKFLIIIILMLSVLCVTFYTNVSNAADNAKVKLAADKTEAVAGDTIKITVGIKDITGIDNGIVAFQGILKYDNTIFESVESEAFEGLNSWDKPSYNEKNGNFLTAKGDFVKNDEDILTLSLKIKSGANLGNTKIQFTDIQVADIDNEYAATGSEIIVNVIEKKAEDNDNAETNKPSTEEEDKTKKPDNIKKPDNTESKEQLPKTGINGSILIVIGAILIIGMISINKYQKYKNIK